MDDTTLTYNGSGFSLHDRSRVASLHPVARVATVTEVWHDGVVIGKVVPFNPQETRWVASYEPFGPCGTFNDKNVAIREVIKRWTGCQAHQAKQQK